jgi:hypothetical protein
MLGGWGAGPSTVILHHVYNVLYESSFAVQGYELLMAQVERSH